MPHFAPRIRDVRPLEWVTVVLLITSIVGGVLFISLVRKQNVLSRTQQNAVTAGEQAHTRQCKVLPASIAIYTDALNRHVISQAQFKLITGSVAALECTPSK